MAYNYFCYCLFQETEDIYLEIFEGVSSVTGLSSFVKVRGKCLHFLTQKDFRNTSEL